MDHKKFVEILGFTPKENTANIYCKQYPLHGGYHIDVDFGKGEIHYNEIVSDSKTTQNFSQPENFVILECVDRLLSKGYKPQNIILEKVWRSGHGTSGRLDICVTHDDGSPYLLIECKTYGKEFDKELAKTRKDGGQLFTYFQLSGCKADVIMLYASDLKGKKVDYKNEIIKIEDEYRSGETKDIYEKWNKLTKDNGIFDSWVKPYNFQSKAFTKEQLKEIRPEDSSFIFNRFLEILRHNVVSDKGNAFNKIFTLFLCKVYDETSAKEGEELQFQWKEGVDNHVDFQLRLTELYSKGMQKFLERTVSDFNEDDFNKRCANLNEDTKKYLLQEVNKLRLEKNNEFAIKEVYDAQSFEENARVVKEVVELIQGYRIRYNKRQQYLSDFFELLLTTGLKQEAGQFFTPVPIAQFIIKSLPLDEIVEEKLKQKDGEILPYMIDYAAGSGHFLTEYMHEVQGIINQSTPKNYIDATAKRIKGWQDDHFDWATQYVYGVEKDYRLVKVGKVGCYLHGDGLANVILSDGLANFNKNKEYKGKLKKSAKDGSKENQQFDVVLSNPPYSVSSFRQTTRDYYTENDFELYGSLTDNSSEIECLFIERTKQLLKDGGVAGVVLPSSILSNAGIYTKAREMILQHFDVVAITELGSNTFMATGTNTVVLFLRRRNNYNYKNVRDAVDRYFTTLAEVTVNGIEKPVTKYVSHVWEGLDYADYLTLLQKSPNDKVKAHEIYADYRKKIKAKDEAAFWQEVLTLESEKLTYFIVAYPQRVVLVKSGEKDAEKRFLGYEFSNRRGSEGIHPIQRGKTIEECTQLFDANNYDNPDKASTYVQRAFKGDFESVIDDSMQGNVSRTRLVDMLTFDRVDFEKSISTAIKKKVKIESEWDVVVVENLCEIGRGRVISRKEIKEKPGKYPVYSSQTSNNGIFGYLNSFDFDGEYVTWTTDGIYAGSVFYRNGKFNCTNICGTLKAKTDIVNMKFLSFVLPFYTQNHVVRVANPKLMNNVMAQIKIPLPPLEVQQKIVAEIEALEKKETEAKEFIADTNSKIDTLLSDITGKELSLNSVAPFAVESTKIDDISLDTYITTDNMLQNKMCVVPFVGTPNISSITKYEANDILMSNIRPYLKKIWFANYEGGCSKDVLVFRVSDSSQYQPQFIYYMMRRDAFFDYVMEGKKGVKMPRGNKDEIMKYKISIPSLTEQQEIVAKIEALEEEIATARAIIDATPALKNEVLKKYL
ncbi:MAG: restriction endonuclease subunit S [Bacteroidales bacterium]|jgi:type I restriction enzyme M protein|nr:restriction endonuclease subunit S [Bacteroidales bacterium]